MDIAETSAMHERDTTWDRALEAVRSVLQVPTALSTLIRGSWGGHISSKDFLRLMGFPGANSACLLRAALSTRELTSSSSSDVEVAIEELGVRASAVIVSVNYVCQSILESAPPEKVWVPVLKEMMNEVEVGYHFGMNAESVGCEQGMLVGFSYWAGIAALLARHPREFSEWHAAKKTKGDRLPSLSLFGCEAFQTGALALQQLGFGADIATAAAIATGDLQADLVQLKPDVATWRAARQWVSALSKGEMYPEDKAAQEMFPALIPPPLYELGREDALPAHLAMLHDHVKQVRDSHSTWTWHLPKDTYEESAREVAKSSTKHTYTTSRSATGVSRG
jgi:hypothetical protein